MGYEPPLEKVNHFIRRFLILPSESDYDIFTLWIAHTYFTHKIKTTPRLAIISPEYGCGKSRCLEVLESLTFKGEKLDHHTRSYLMRTVDSIRTESGRPPTLLIDEIDSVFRAKNEEGEATRAFANTGYRATGFYGITEGDRKKTPTKFQTFAPMALAGKGEVLPESVMTRAVIIRLQKRMENESVEDFLTDIVGFESEELREELLNWSDYCADEISNLNPELPVRDRDREVWLPLFKVAHLAGGEWIKRAEIALANIQEDKLDNTLPKERQLLEDVWKIFQGAEKDRMKSAHIVISLAGLKDSEWDTFNFGKPISDKALAKRLRTYGIKSAQMRFEDGHGAKGYYRSEVESAVRRYLDPSLPETTETTETELTPTLEYVSPVSSVSLSGYGEESIEEMLTRNEEAINLLMKTTYE
jgi:hypothetical protein